MNTQPSRDLGMAMMAIVGFVIVATAGIWVITAGGWWLLALVPAVFLLLALGYGIGDSLQLKDRSKDNA